MAEQHESQEELPGATKYENEAVYQRNPADAAGEPAEFEASEPPSEQGPAKPHRRHTRPDRPSAGR